MKNLFENIENSNRVDVMADQLPSDSADQPPSDQPPSDQKSAVQQSIDQKSADQKSTDPVPIPRPLVRPLTLSLNGDRPFAGAVVLYKEAMKGAINRAVALLDANPSWMSSRVMYNLYDQLQVPCLDMPDGTESVRKFYAHVPHYGPQSKTVPFIGEAPENFRIRSFCVRDTSIWMRMAPYGTDGKKEVAYPPFRELQMELATRRKLFLLDHSYHFRKPDGTIRYYQHIVIVRKLAQPVFLWHEYGLFPRALMFN